MNLKDIILIGTLLVASTVTASAATFNLGDVTAGITTTETLTIQTIDFVEFSLDAPNGSYVSMLDIAVTTVPGSNFRPIIGLYFDGTLVAQNDSRVFGGTASLSFSDTDVPADGNYTLGVGGWISRFTTDIADASSTAFFRNGTYELSITPTIGPVPLPAGGLLLLTGLCALVFGRRRTIGTTPAV